MGIREESGGGERGDSLLPCQFRPRPRSLDHLSRSVSLSFTPVPRLAYDTRRCYTVLQSVVGSRPSEISPQDPLSSPLSSSLSLSFSLLVSRARLLDGNLRKDFVGFYAAIPSIAAPRRRRYIADRGASERASERCTHFIAPCRCRHFPRVGFVWDSQSKMKKSDFRLVRLL